MTRETIRNFMLTLLALGVAGAAGSFGTFAQFNAVTTNPSNTFSTGFIQVTNTANGGAACTSQSSGGGANNSPATCSSLLTLSNMVAGDSKVGTLTVSNTSSSNGPVQLSLSVSSSTSNSIVANVPTASASAGLGMLLFRCVGASPGGSYNSPVTCNTSSGQLYPLYGSCTGTPTMGSSGFNTTQVASANTTDQNIVVGGVTCTPTATALNAISNLSLTGFDAVPSPGSTGTPALGISAGHSDFYAGIVYLPGIAGNTQSSAGTNTATLTFNWTAAGIGSTH